MQQLDIPIITKTYELYRALHDLQKGIPKRERYSLWSRIEGTALQMLEGFVHVGYLPLERRVLGAPEQHDGTPPRAREQTLA
jgi:hypothetical protein